MQTTIYTSIKKWSNTFTKLQRFAKRQLILNTLITVFFFSQYTFAQTSICPEDCEIFCIEGNNFPLGGTIDFYYDTNAAFDPFNGEGTLMGSAMVGANNVATPTNTTNSDTSCPSILGIMVDACNGTGVESDNEYLLLVNGNTNLAVFNLDIDLPNNTNINTVTGFVPAATVTTTLTNAGVTGPCLTTIDGTSTIPANAFVVVFTASDLSMNYDFTDLCNSVGTIYVLMKDQAPATGTFSNTGGRTTVLNVAGCTATSYSYDGATTGDGAFFQFSAPDPIFTSAGNNGGTPASGSAFLSPLSCAAPPIDVTNNDDPVCFQYTFDSSFCNLGGNTGFFVKAITNPLAASCSESDATSTTFNYSMSCPEAVLSISGDNNPECALGNIQTFITFDTEGTYDFTITNGTTTTPFDGIVVNAGNVNTPISLTTTATIGDYFYSIVSIFLDVDDDDTPDSGCNISFSGTPSATIYPTPTANYIIGEPICAGEAVFTITPLGGTPPYVVTYTDPNGTTQTAEGGPNPFTIEATISGNYSLVSITDDNALCSSFFQEFTIVELTSPPTLNAPPTSSLCGNGTTSIDLTSLNSSIFSGSATFDWLGIDAGTAAGQEQNYTPADGQTLRVEVTPTNGCPAYQDVTFNASACCNLDPNLSSNSPICVGNDLTLTATVANGSPDYVYQWSGGIATSTASSSTANATINNANNSNAGIYTVTITDGNNCTATATTQVIINDLPTANVQGSMVCLNDPVTLSLSTNATTGATYEWSGGSSMATQTVNTANAGTQTFTVTVTNANDCTNTATTQVIVNNLPTASVQGSTVCLNDPVTLSVSTDATTGATYSWSGGSSMATQTVNTANAGTQTFTVTVTNANNCTNTATAQVIVNDLPTASVQGSTVCLNDPVTLSLSTDATTGATYSWSGGSSMATQTVNTANAGTQTFTVTVTNANNCTNTATAQVIVNDLPTASVQGSTVCINEPVTLSLSTNATTGATYSWSGGSSMATQTVDTSNSGTQTFTVTVTNANDCTNTATTQVIVNNLPTASVQGSMVCLNDPVTLSVSTDATTGASYQWSGGSTSAMQVVNTDIAGTQTFTVTVTNANDCSSTATAQVIVNDLPTASVQGSTVCLNDPVTLSVSTNATTGAAYSWSGGSTSATQVVSTDIAGGQTFTVTVTNANDCTNTETAQVIVNDLPTAIVQGSTVCLNEPVTLSVSTNTTTGASYQWSGGSTAATQVVNTDIAGTQTFTVTVANSNDCTNTATTQVIVNDLPTASVQGSTVCLNDPVTLSVSTDATMSASYQWSGGSTSATQEVNTDIAGTQTFTVTVTNANDCTNTATAQVIVNDLPTASVQGSAVCLNDPVTLSVSTNATIGASYSWSGGSTSATQVVNTDIAGTQTFTVTVTNANDCTNTETAQVIVNDLPTAIVQGSTVCLNDPVTLSVSTDATTGASYQWSGGSTSATQEVNTDIAGTQTFTVTVTNADNCTNTATAQVIVNDLPTASVQGETVCLNDFVTLSVSTNATTGASYQWSGGSTAATQVVNTDIAGTQTFTVTVTNANDCTNTATAQVIVNDLPTASVQGSTVCLNDPVTLSVSTNATTGASYQWSGGSTSATQVVNTDIAGTQTFTVTVTNANDCSSTATAQVIVNDLPTASVQGSTVCLNDPVTLSVSTDATTGASYQWSGGSSMATQTVNTSNSGMQTFIVTVTNANDCSSTATAQVIVNDLPTASVQGSTVCLNDPVTLSVSTNATTGASYQWSSGSSAATQVVNTDIAGTQTFTVTVTNANDCTNTAIAQVIVNDLPTASVQGSTVCLNDPVTLSVSTDAATGATYSWSGGSSAATQTVNTANAGTQTFTVTVTNSNDCTNTATAQVIVNDLPTASVQGSTVCLNEPVTLSLSTNATTGAMYSWSGGSTSATQVVNTDIAGTQTFTVTVTNANNCTNTATAQVIVNDLPTASVQGSTVCLNDPVTLSLSTNATTGATYSWSGGSSMATQTVNTSNAGTQTFTVTVTNANNCTNTATTQVIVNDLPTASVQGATVCLNEPVTLSVSTNATTGATYEWSGGSTSAMQVVNTDIAGTQTFTVTVTNANNCTNTATAQVIVNDLPTASVQGATVCLNDPVTLSVSTNATTGATYEWSGGSTSATQVVSTDIAGTQTFTVTVTNANDCSSTATAQVIVNDLPTASVQGSTVCLNEPVTLSVSTDATIGATYEWSDGSTSAVQVVNTDIAGTQTFTVTVTNANNCSTTAIAQVIVNDLPTASVQGSTVCLNEPVTLSVSTNATIGATYSWSGGSTVATQVVNTDIAGTQTFTVTVTNSDNCSTTAIAQVVVNDLPTASVQGSTVCLDEPVTLSVSTNVTTGASYQWSSGSTAAKQLVNTDIAGTQTFTVTVTNANDCSTTATAEVVVHELPVVALDNQVVCEGETAILEVGSGLESYVWSNGAMGQGIEVGEGNYEVEVRDANGCTAVAQASVVEITPPAAEVQSIVSVCNDTNEGTTLLVLMNLVLSGDTNGTWRDGSGNVVMVFDGNGRATGAYGFTYTLPSDGICPSVTYTVTIGVQNCDIVCAELDGTQAVLESEVCSGDGLELMDGAIVQNDFVGGIVEWVLGDSPDFNAYSTDAELFTGTLPTNENCEVATYYLKARLGGIAACLDESAAFEVEVYPDVAALTEVSSEENCTVEVATCSDFVVSYEGGSFEGSGAIVLEESNESPITISVVNPNAPTDLECGEVVLSQEFECEENAPCCSFVPPAKADFQVCSGDDLDLEVALEGNCPNIVQWSNGVSGTLINTGALINNTCEPIEVTFAALITTTDNCPQQTQTFTIAVLPVPSANNVEVNKEDCRIELNTCNTFDVSYRVNGGAAQSGNAYTVAVGEMADVEFLVESVECGIFEVAEMVDCSEACPMIEAVESNVSICSGQVAELAVAVSNVSDEEVRWSNGAVGGMIEVEGLVNTGCEPIVEVFTAQIAATGTCEAVLVDIEVTVFPEPESQASVEVLEDNCTVVASACEGVGILYRLSDGSLVASDTYVAEAGSGINTVEFLFTSPYTCGNTTINATINCVENGAIGNFVWYDLNENGLQDLGEPGIAGVFVHLYAVDGTLLATERTDGNGYYLFDDLPSGAYYVVFDLPNAYEVTQLNVGMNDGIDSDANPTTGQTDIINLGQGEVNLTIDAGLVGTTVGSISNFVWLDVNGNSVQDEGEPGVANVVINLLDENGNVIGSTVTDENGFYAFTNLPSGRYQIEVVGDLNLVPENEGNDDRIDSDVNVLDGLSDIIVLDEGENDVTIDVGIRPSECGTIAGIFGSIGDCLITNGVLSILTSEVTLGFGEELIYVLYTDENDVMGSIIDQNGTPFFEIDTNENPTLFVAAISGFDLDGDGLPDADAVCFNIEEGPTVQAQILNLEVQFQCAPDNLTYDLVIQVFDDIDGRYDIEVNGELIEDVPANQLFEYGNLQNGEPYTVQIIEADTDCVLATISGIGDCIKLPVSLLEFNGEVLKEGNQLQWITASELNNDYFNLHYSTDGVNFEVVAAIEGNSTTSEANIYSFLHREAANGTVYYYLSQTDFDGMNGRISNTISLQRGEMAFELIEVLPIPSSDFVHVRFHAPQGAADAQMALYDVLGRNVWNAQYKAVMGFNELEVDVRGLAVGVYVLSLEVNGEQRQVKIVVD